MKKNHFRKAIIFAVLLAVLLGITAIASAEDIINSQDHVWDNGTYYKAADCDHPEQWIYRCTVPGCGSYKYEYKGSTNPNAHQWGEWIVDTAPTCTSNGTRHRVCQIVSHHVETGTIAPTGHDWDDWFVSKKPTCLEKGEETRICKNDPSHKETREVPATGHDWDEWVETKKPTCLEKGVETRVCKKDSSHKETREVPATGHNWGDWVVTKEPTCLESGIKTRTCKNDPSHTESQAVSPLGHDWGEWVVVKQPTCTTKGQEKSICKRDSSHIEIRDVPAIGHNWGNWVVTIKPTCNDAGEETRTCKNDPTHKETRTVPATGHKWDNGTVIVQPTLDKEGLKEYVCQNDPSHTKTEVIPKLTRYGNTVCAFGPRLRDVNLYPYNSDQWYMFTPFDASQDGVQTYELVASNEFIVGSLTLTIRNGELFVDYSLFDKYNFKITLEFFTVLNRMGDITRYEPEDLMNLCMKTNQAINLADTFGDDTSLVLYFCSRCDYTGSSKYLALQYNSAAHQRLIRDMLTLMD